MGQTSIPIISPRLAKMAGLIRQETTAADRPRVAASKTDNIAPTIDHSDSNKVAPQQPKSPPPDDLKSLSSGKTSSTISPAPGANPDQVTTEFKDLRGTIRVTPEITYPQRSSTPIESSINPTKTRLESGHHLRYDNFIVTVVTLKALQGPTATSWQITVTDGRQTLVFDTQQAIQKDSLVLMQSQLQRDGTVKLQILAASMLPSRRSEIGIYEQLTRNLFQDSRSSYNNQHTAVSHLGNPAHSIKSQPAWVAESLKQSAVNKLPAEHQMAKIVAEANPTKQIHSLSELDHWLTSRLQTLQPRPLIGISNIINRASNINTDLSDQNDLNTQRRHGLGKSGTGYPIQQPNQLNMRGGQKLAQSLTQLKELLQPLISINAIHLNERKTGTSNNSAAKTVAIATQLAEFLQQLPDSQQLASAKTVRHLINNSPTLFESNIMQSIKSNFDGKAAASTNNRFNIAENFPDNHTDRPAKTQTPAEHQPASKESKHHVAFKQLFSSTWGSQASKTQVNSEGTEGTRSNGNHLASDQLSLNIRTARSSPYGNFEATTQTTFSNNRLRGVSDFSRPSHAATDNVKNSKQDISLQGLKRFQDQPLNHMASHLQSVIAQLPSSNRSRASIPENFVHYSRGTTNYDSLPKPATIDLLKPLLSSLQTFQIDDWPISNLLPNNIDRQTVFEQTQRAIQQSLAAIEIEQYRSIPRDEFSCWSLPLIFQYQNAIQAVDLDWHKTKLKESITQQSWRLTLHFELDRLGCFDMVLQLDLPSIEVTMLSESSTTRQQLNQEISNLSQRLTDIGISVTGNKVCHGKAPHHQPLISSTVGLNILT